jgi:hypothetical protein
MVLNKHKSYASRWVHLKRFGWVSLTIFPNFIAVLILFLNSFHINGQQLHVEDRSYSYLKSSIGNFGSLESTSLDSGGVLTFFVSNLDSTNADSVKYVKFFQSGNEYFPEAYRVWPPHMNAAGAGNNLSAITIKGLTYPFMEGDSLDVVVISANGDSVFFSDMKCITSQLKIVNVLRGTNPKELKIYLRNQDTIPYWIDSVFLNEVKYDTLNILNLNSVNGNFCIPPGKIGIYTLVSVDSLENCFPVALRIHYLNPTLFVDEWTSSATRVIEPEFSMGTWSGSGMDPLNEYGRKRLRQFPINSMHGPGNTGLMNIGEYEYYIKTVWEPSFGSGVLPDTSLAGPVIRSNSLEKFIHYWSVDDEPDLNGKPIVDEVLRNQTYWLNDKNTPSYVNLASEKKFNRYGWFTDVVAMDHYAAPTAPNIIPGTWIPLVGRAGELKEALEYSEQLKLNTEPRLMESWCQLAAGGTWSAQPDNFGVNYQFWSHVMAGSKGIHWFVAQSTTKDDFPNLWDEANDIMRHFNGVKNLFYYSEPHNGVDVINGKVNSKILIGEKAVAIVVVNDSTNYFWNGGTFSWAIQTDSTDFEIEFELPNWINPAEFFKLTSTGKAPGTGLVYLGANKYRISSTEKLFKKAQVYILGEVDTIAPSAPTQINIPEYIDLANYTISWKEPFDEFGIDGYILKWNGGFVDSVRYPIYEVINGDYNCTTGNWSVESYDLQGNLSAPGFLPITISIPSPIILMDPQNALVNEFDDTSFTITAIGDGLHYFWQQKSPTGSWTFITDTIQYSGINTNSLHVINVPYSLLNYEYRCLVTTNCGDSILTNYGLLDIVNSVDELSEELIFKLSPNPSSGNFLVTLPSSEVVVEFQLTDLFGRRVEIISKKSNNKFIIFEVPSFTNGLYMLSGKSKHGNSYTIPLVLIR